MDITSLEASTLTIERFSASYLVPTQHPAPESVQAHLDEAMTLKDLPLALATLAQYWNWASDPRVLLYPSPCPHDGCQRSLGS